MPETENPERLERAPRTAWHPLLVALLERYLPKGYRLTPELQLTRMPQRIDIVVVRHVGPAGDGADRRLRSIVDHFAPHTLIEHKGPTDEVEGEDALFLLGYGAQYMRLAHVADPADVCLMVVCDRITRSFVVQLENFDGKLALTERGIWRGSLARFPLHVVETSQVHARPSDHLLYAFSRAFLSDPEKFPPLDDRDLATYLWLYEQVEQFRRKRGDMAQRHMEDIDISFERGLDWLSPEVRRKVLRRFRPAERLEGLTPEQLVENLTPEDRERLRQLLS